MTQASSSPFLPCTLRELISNLPENISQPTLCEKLQEIEATHKEYVGHLVRTKHQGQYHQFVMKNVKPGELVMIIDYKMKLELRVHSRETEAGMKREGFHYMAVLL